MGIVRRHPFLTLIFVVGSLPVLALIALEVVRHTPECAAWRAEVARRVGDDPKLSPWDEYHRGDMPVDEYFGNVRDHVEYDMRETRPLFCD